MPAGARATRRGGQFLGHLGGEEGGVGIGAAVDLAVHGGDHVRMAVAERGHGGAAAGVEIGVAGAVAQPDARGATATGGVWRRLRWMMRLMALRKS
jgi:hypothetical protein